MLAILIWLNASQANDPSRLQSFQIPIDFIGQPENSTLVTSDENMVFVVEARSSVLNQLTTDDFTAVVDLSQVPLSQDAIVDVNLQPKKSGVTITSPSPDKVTVRLEQLVSRDVPVVLDIRGSVARGHTQGDALVDPEVITVVGTAAQVEKLDSARVTVFLNNVSQTFVATPVPIFMIGKGASPAPAASKASAAKTSTSPSRSPSRPTSPKNSSRSIGAARRRMATACSASTSTHPASWSEVCLPA